MSDSLRDTIVPKSDQLNADDLLVGPITVTVMDVRRGDKDQPVIVDIDGGRQPYKPCKSMRRVLIAAWGDKPEPWLGRQMTLFCDPEVKFGGVKVGGIRISHLSHIDSDRTLMLTTAKGKRSEFNIRRLATLEPYTPERFAELLPEWRKLLAKGTGSVEALIAKIETKAALTDEQRAAIQELQPKGTDER